MEAITKEQSELKSQIIHDEFIFKINESIKAKNFSESCHEYYTINLLMIANSLGYNRAVVTKKFMKELCEEYQSKEWNCCYGDLGNFGHGRYCGLLFFKDDIKRYPSTYYIAYCRGGGDTYNKIKIRFPKVRDIVECEKYINDSYVWYGEDFYKQKDEIETMTDTLRWWTGEKGNEKNIKKSLVEGNIGIIF